MVPTPQYIQYLSKVSAFATSKTHKWPKATRKAAANANTFSEEETVVPFCQYLGGGNCGGGYRRGKGRSGANGAFGGREESLRILFKE